MKDNELLSSDYLQNLANYQSPKNFTYINFKSNFNLFVFKIIKKQQFNFNVFLNRCQITLNFFLDDDDIFSKKKEKTKSKSSQEKPKQKTKNLVNEEPKLKPTSAASFFASSKKSDSSSNKRKHVSFIFN